MVTVKLLNCCHNSFPNISIKFNFDYQDAFTCIGDKIAGFKTCLRPLRLESALESLLDVQVEVREGNKLTVSITT